MTGFFKKSTPTKKKYCEENCDFEDSWQMKKNYFSSLSCGKALYFSCSSQASNRTRRMRQLVDAPIELGAVVLLHY